MKRIYCLIMAAIIIIAIGGCNGSTPSPSKIPESSEVPVSSEAPASSEATSVDFPTATIKIIVPFNPGGSTDLMARVLAPEMSARLGVPVIVENKPGGGGAIGMIEMIQSNPDGHTIILCSISAATLTPNNSDVGYTNKEMAPIAQIAQLSTGIYVRADSGITTVEEFIEVCEAEYGTKTFSTSGTGGVHHLTAELFMKAIDKPGLINHVPFDSGTEAITAVLGNQVDFSFGDAGDGLPFVEDGTLRVLAMGSDPGRDYYFPDVPSFKELGYDVVMGPWTGFAAPAGTPIEIIELLDNTIKECMELPNIIEGFKNLSQPIAYMDHTDFTEKWMAEYDKNKAIIEGIG